MTPPEQAAAAGSGALGIAAHRPAIWRYLRMLGASADEADELAQETMLGACRTQLATDPAVARAFLRGVARNQWLRTRRFWQRQREREIAAAVEELWLATADADGGDERIERLRHCLDGLAPRTRAAFELHYRDGIAWPAVAAQLGLLANGVKTLVQRARQALRQCLERRTP
ncbi:MAG: sigma-70 family RNA polymerase sigma factor [Planctomycetes bacterium]|nr:sigma-70 family RNA polymerase sigma factor [Planctomycetota bacterium]